MSEESVRKIILKAYDDAEYRTMLLTNLDEAIKDSELTESEIQKLSDLTEDFFDESLEMEERISRWGGFIGGGV